MRSPGARDDVGRRCHLDRLPIQRAAVFGPAGKMFFCELATLVDIMLLGYWIEMKSVMGASKALEELAKLMPS